MSKVAILCPTWNNPQYLEPCVNSLLQSQCDSHIYIINNGHKDSVKFTNSEKITVIYADGNKGWEGGLKLGLEASTEPYVCFFNDDAYIPPSSSLWLEELLMHFEDSETAAVGPSSNVVMGMQSIFAQMKERFYNARFLVGFCMLLDRKKLTEVGGVDDSLPGGDDLDLSIRLRDKGYKLIGDRTVFVYHHGFKTGERVHGTSDKTGGWNSYEFTERTDHALIKKHGFKKWWYCRMGVYQFDD